jgi:hypothetical protein
MPKSLSIVGLLIVAVCLTDRDVRGLALALIAPVAVLTFTVRRAVATTRRRSIDRLAHALVRAHAHAHEIVLDWCANVKLELAFAPVVGVIGRSTTIGLDVAGELVGIFSARL